MRPRVLAAVAAAASVTLLVPSAASATHSWGGYHWARTSNPFTVRLGDNVSSQWDTSLQGASADWTKSAVLDTSVVTGSTAPKNCRPTAGRVEVCNARYGNTGWLGVASISVTGGVHITQGTVKLNDTYFSTSTYNTPAWRNLVTCQEIGHTLGLDHQDENFTNANLGTCMDYTNSPGTNQHPNKHDYDELALIYSHLDSTTTVGAAARPGAAGAPASNDASGWGRVVEGSRAAGHSTHVRDLGRGDLVVTFVTWAR
ncbi:MAG TPA: hypothetical protein VFJ94_09835 [Intrasporangium sp.]|uniref:hypothetical protein n=1 Tax=Intrasporangium sp. TaxID=1925024 RepID=UPI002D79423F|nr:hypothetical protein [Intrasporangium sp.]HET7398807.1 hypothetical protein [Intrasporangium sp.]